MSNIFQTGQTNSEKNRTTSPTRPAQEEVIFNHKETFTFNVGQTNYSEAKQQEPTVEEEEKFYKKVFKTSLI